MNIYFRELGNESPLLVKLIMQSIYKNNDRKVRHLGSKRFGIQFLIKGIYTYNGMLYVHTQTKNSSNVPFDTDFIDRKSTRPELQSRQYLVCRLLLEKKKTRTTCLFHLLH